MGQLDALGAELSPIGVPSAWVGMPTEASLGFFDERDGNGAAAHGGETPR
jgi:hypothetical protein